MNLFPRWGAARRRRDEDAVVQAMRMLRPAQTSAELIALLSGLSPRKTTTVLARMERDGTIAADWADGRQRRVYRLTPPGGQR